MEEKGMFLGKRNSNLFRCHKEEDNTHIFLLYPYIVPMIKRISAYGINWGKLTILKAPTH